MYLRLLAVATALVATSALGQNTSAPAQGSAPSAETPVSTPMIAQAQSGKIVMYRGSSVFGAGVACPIRYKGQEIIELARGKFAAWIVPPGRYILNNHTSSIEVSVDPGETRYVRCMIKMGMLAGRADLQIVDEESFNEHRNEFEEKPMESAAAALTPITTQSSDAQAVQQ